ncbi:MAG: hypothetical protein AAFZ49_13645 [Cyanobacteria bacterium J06659_2]
MPAAIADYTYAIELDGGYSEAYAARGRSRYESGDAHGAYQDFTHVIRQDSTVNADVYYY